MLTALLLLHGWLLQPHLSPLRAPARTPFGRVVQPPRAALDYKDPDVAAEFAACQSLDTEEVEDELATSGVVPPPTMNDMDMRMMLVEMRLRKAGKVGGQKAAAPKKPLPGANEFEMALYEKPAFKELYEEWQKARKTNELNLVRCLAARQKPALPAHARACRAHAHCEGRQCCNRLVMGGPSPRRRRCGSRERMRM